MAFALLGPVFMLSAQAQEPALIIKSDRGGVLSQRVRDIAALRQSGRQVQVQGLCLSACTMYLALSNACLSPGASLGFHGPSNHGKPLPPEQFEYWSAVMAEGYTRPLKSWFMARGRYIQKGYYALSGTELIQMGYKRC